MLRPNPTRKTTQSVYQELSKKFYEFLDKYEKYLDEDTIVKLLQRRGRTTECMEFAEQKVNLIKSYYNRDIMKK